MSFLNEYYPQAIQLSTADTTGYKTSNVNYYINLHLLH